MICRQHPFSATARLCVEYVHCKQDPIYLFPEMTLRGLVPNFHVYVSVSDLYIFPRSICLFCCRKYVDWSWEIAHRHMNVEIRTEAAQFPEKEYINRIFVAVHPSLIITFIKNITLICRQHPFSATARLCVEYVHCKQDPIYVFPEMTLRSLIPKFPCLCVCERFTGIYIPTIDLPILLQELCGPILRNRSQTHECGNQDWGRAIPWKEIHK